MLTQKVSTIDELLQFVSTLRQKHGVRLWFRGEENADLTLIPSIQRSQKRLDSERYIANDFYIRARQILDNPPDKHNYAGWVSLRIISSLSSLTLSNLLFIWHSSTSGSFSHLLKSLPPIDVEVLSKTHNKVPFLLLSLNFSVY